MNEFPNILVSAVIVLAVPFLRRAFFFRPPWRVESKKTAKRIQFFDVLRGIAIIAVIGIHVVDFYRLELETETTGLLFLNAFLRFAIPLFIITSGMLLDPHDLQNEQSRWLFYWRKLIRIFIPYALLTTFWLVTQYDFSFLVLLISIFRGDVLGPYYFVIVLFELYLLYPFAVRLAARRWFLPVSLGVSMCAAATEFHFVLGIPLPFEYLFFFAYGIVLRPLLVAPQRVKTMQLAPWLSIAGLYFVGFFIAPDYYYNDLYFWGLAMFWILYLKQHYLPKNLKVGLAHVGRLSLWIFLLHYPILFWIGKTGTSWINALPTGVAVFLLISSTLVLTSALASVIAGALKAGEKRLQTLSAPR